MCVCVQATLKPGRPATEVALQAGLSPRRKGGLELETWEADTPYTIIMWVRALLLSDDSVAPE